MFSFLARQIVTVNDSQPICNNSLAAVMSWMILVPHPENVVFLTFQTQYFLPLWANSCICHCHWSNLQVDMHFGVTDILPILPSCATIALTCNCSFITGKAMEILWVFSHFLAHLVLIVWRIELFHPYTMYQLFDSLNCLFYCRCRLRSKFK